MNVKITELFAFICTDENGDEGIPAINLIGMVMPLIGADRKRIESLREAGQDSANKTGRQVRIAVFRGMEVIEVLEPQPKPNN
jgi:hypothetical protein